MNWLDFATGLALGVVGREGRLHGLKPAADVFARTLHELYGSRLQLFVAFLQLVCFFLKLRELVLVRTTLAARAGGSAASTGGSARAVFRRTG